MQKNEMARNRISGGGGGGGGGVPNKIIVSSHGPELAYLSDISLEKRR